MARFPLPLGGDAQGWFKAYILNGAEITLTVDDFGGCQIGNILSLAASTPNPRPILPERYKEGVDSAIFTGETGWYDVFWHGEDAGKVGYVQITGFADEVIPFDVSPKSIHFTKTGGSAVLTVSGTHNAITVSNPARSWISAATDGVSVGTNSSVRRGNSITFSTVQDDGTRQSVSVFVEQDGEPFVLMPSFLNFGDGGGGGTVNYKPRTGITVSRVVNDDFISLTSNGVSVSENLTTNPKSGTVTYKAITMESTLENSQNLKVNQTAGTGSGGGTGGGTGSGDTTGKHPAGSLPDGSGRVGTVTFKNADGNSLNVIVQQTLKPI